MTNFTSSCGASRSRLLQSLRADSPLAGHLTSTIFTTAAGTTSSTDILCPSWNAYAVSHHEQRRSHAVSRTKTQRRPACDDSPWIEWKISFTVNMRFQNADVRVQIQFTLKSAIDN